MDIKKNIALVHVKQHLNIVSGIIKSRLTTLNIKMIRNYQQKKKNWEIKKRNGTPKIAWKIIRICPYNPNSKRCLLCLNEKLETATYNGDSILNKREMQKYTAEFSK